MHYIILHSILAYTGFFILFKIARFRVSNWSQNSRQHTCAEFWSKLANFKVEYLGQISTVLHVSFMDPGQNLVFFSNIILVKSRKIFGGRGNFEKIESSNLKNPSGFPKSGYNFPPTVKISVHLVIWFGL